MRNVCLSCVICRLFSETLIFLFYCHYLIASLAGYFVDTDGTTMERINTCCSTANDPHLYIISGPPRTISSLGAHYFHSACVSRWVQYLTTIYSMMSNFGSFHFISRTYLRQLVDISQNWTVNGNLIMEPTQRKSQKFLRLDINAMWQKTHFTLEQVDQLHKFKQHSRLVVLLLATEPFEPVWDIPVSMNQKNSRDVAILLFLVAFKSNVPFFGGSAPGLLNKTSCQF